MSVNSGIKTATNTPSTVGVATGRKYLITAEDIIVINDLIRQHVQNCFDVENYLIQQVEQATTVEEIESINVESAFSN